MFLPLFRHKLPYPLLLFYFYFKKLKEKIAKTDKEDIQIDTIFFFFYICFQGNSTHITTRMDSHESEILPSIKFY